MSEYKQKNSATISIATQKKASDKKAHVVIKAQPAAKARSFINGEDRAECVASVADVQRKQEKKK